METQDLDIQNSFNKTLQKSDLDDIAVDLSEATLDSYLDEEVLKEVPVIRTMIALIKFGANVQDRLFTKKILSFLQEIKNTDPEERKEIIQKIDESQKYRLKVGEKLLYILDSCHDYESAELVAKMFSAFLEKQISYEEFLDAASVLESISIKELNWFLKTKEEYFNIEDTGHLMGSGLFEMLYEEINVDIREEDDRKILRDRGNKYRADVDGGELWITTSSIGDCIKNILNQRRDDGEN